MSKTITVSDETWKKIESQVLKDNKKIEKINITIRNRFTEAIIWESKKETYKEVLEEVILEGASLEYANLEGANLEGANLEYANLKYANLEYANLEYANLEGADLEGAKTSGCTVNFTKDEYEQAKQFIEGLK